MAAAVLVNAGRSALSKRPAMAGALAEKTHVGNAGAAPSHGHNKNLTCSQRIEQATAKRTQVTISEQMSWDAEALFRKFDAEGTQLLSRGALTEALREVGLEKALGAGFRATAQLAFDAHSADSHFLSLSEFKQMYCAIHQYHPNLLPRQPKLKIVIVGAKGLPPADANGKADPFCTVQVIGKPTSKSQTRHIEKTLEPYWGEEMNDKYGYEDGDNLLFEVFDYDRDIHKGARCEFLGRAILPSHEFHRLGGFDGKVHLQDCVKGYNPWLSLRVSMNGFPEPPQPLRIMIHSARGLPPADPNGKADPFVIVQLVGKPQSRNQTKVVTRTLEPIWDFECGDKYRYEEGDAISFEVRDYDGKGKATELLGRCILENSAFHKPGGFDGEIPLTDVPEKGYYPMLDVTVLVRALEEPEKPTKKPFKRRNEEEEEEHQDVPEAGAA